MHWEPNHRHAAYNSFKFFQFSSHHKIRRLNIDGLKFGETRQPSQLIPCFHPRPGNECAGILHSGKWLKPLDSTSLYISLRLSVCLSVELSVLISLHCRRKREWGRGGEKREDEGEELLSPTPPCTHIRAPISVLPPHLPRYAGKPLERPGLVTRSAGSGYELAWRFLSEQHGLVYCTCTSGSMSFTGSFSNNCCSAHSSRFYKRQFWY